MRLLDDEIRWWNGGFLFCFCFVFQRSFSFRGCAVFLISFFLKIFVYFSPLEHHLHRDYADEEGEDSLLMLMNDLLNVRF